MSRKVSENPKDWDEDDLLYLHQFDQRADEVNARAEELGVTLPGPNIPGAPQQAGRAEPGLPCPTCGQVVPLPDEITEHGGDGEIPPYSEWRRADLVAELETRGIEHSDATNNEQRAALLVADDEANG